LFLHGELQPQAGKGIVKRELGFCWFVCAFYGKIFVTTKTRNRKVSLKAGMLGGLDAGKLEGANYF
jgi:hypothetical protein